MSGTFDFQHMVAGQAIPKLQSRFVVGVEGGSADVTMGGNDGTVAITPSLTQAAPALMVMEAQLGLVQRQTNVGQLSPANIETLAIAGSGGPATAAAQMDAALLHVESFPAVASVVGGNVGQVAPADVVLEGNIASVAVFPIEITQNVPAELTMQAYAGGTGIGQVNPALIELVGGEGYTQGIIQTQPADIALSGFIGGVAVSQSNPAQIALQAFAGAGRGIVQSLPAALTVAASEAVLGSGQISPADIAIEVSPGALAANVLQLQSADIAFDGLTGALGLAQVNPAQVAIEGGLGEAPAQEPTNVDQTAPALVDILGQVGNAGLGDTPTCVWFAPADCVETNLATTILYKKPASEVWYAFDFGPRMQIDERIASAEVDDQGAGVVGSVPIVESSEPTRVKYRVVNGVDGQNVRIKHLVVTSLGRTLEGDGFLYIRDQ